MKSHHLAVSLMAALVSSAAFADSTDIVNSNNQVGIQAMTTNVNYTETGDGRLGSQIGTLDTENGNLDGYALGLSVMRD